MGVDTLMQVKVTKPLLPAELTKLSWRLAGAFYKEPFWFFDEKDLCIAESEQDSTLLELAVSGRYYGPEYERGPLMTFIAIAEWLEYNLPNCVVLYGNDSDDQMEVFDSAKRQVYKTHFFTHGHHPYQSYFGISRNQTRPLCPRCNELMNNVGGGGAEEFWSCYGCPNNMITSIDKKPLLFTDGDFFEKVKEMRK